MKILAFGASNSRNSINRAMANHALDLLAHRLPDAETELLDLGDFEMPIYSIDREHASGIPQLASDFKAKIAGANLVLISFAEHNSSYSAAYKNLFDWASRLEGKVFADKKLLLLSTSPGGRGGASVLAQAMATLPHHGAQILASLSFPGFYTIFDVEAGVLHDALWSEKLDVLLADVV